MFTTFSDAPEFYLPFAFRLRWFTLRAYLLRWLRTGSGSTHWLHTAHFCRALRFVYAHTSRMTRAVRTQLPPPYLYITRFFTRFVPGCCRLTYCTLPFTFFCHTHVGYPVGSHTGYVCRDYILLPHTGSFALHCCQFCLVGYLHDYLPHATRALRLRARLPHACIYGYAVGSTLRFCIWFCHAHLFYAFTTHGSGLPHAHTFTTHARSCLHPARSVTYLPTRFTVVAFTFTHFAFAHHVVHTHTARRLVTQLHVRSYGCCSSRLRHTAVCYRTVAGYVATRHAVYTLVTVTATALVVRAHALLDSHAWLHLRCHVLHFTRTRICGYTLRLCTTRFPTTHNTLRLPRSRLVRLLVVPRTFVWLYPLLRVYHAYVLRNTPLRLLRYVYLPRSLRLVYGLPTCWFCTTPPAAVLRHTLPLYATAPSSPV